MTLLIHEGNKADNFFLKGGTISEHSSLYNSDFRIVQTIIKHQLEGVETDKWKNLPIRVWEFMRRPQQDFTIYTPCRRQALTTKSEKG